jgi:hypothetical protein
MDISGEAEIALKRIGDAEPEVQSVTIAMFSVTPLIQRR